MSYPSGYTQVNLSPSDAELVRILAAREERAIKTIVARALREYAEERGLSVARSA